MKIIPYNILIRDLIKNYINNDEEGVSAYGGLLNIRPPYQREFVYKDAQRNAVIDTVIKNYPLNVMYWAKTNDGKYEIIDGQQRTISICEYCAGNFSIKIGENAMYFDNMTEEEQNEILDYEIMVYICEGTEREKLEWFKTINIAGEQLTDQELRNAVYSGPWVSDAKKYFSKTNCPAYREYGDYLKGSSIRQEYLETVISWAAAKENISIEEYMSKHQNDENASILWQYFRTIMSWVKGVFPVYRKEMKGLDFGDLYERFHNKEIDSDKLEEKIKELMMDEEVGNKKGIYTYVLSGEEKCLNLRAFDEKIKRETYERQEGICAKCNEHFEYKDMEADHITPWSQGGRTDKENCQMLCKRCNRMKSDK